MSYELISSFNCNLAKLERIFFATSLLIITQSASAALIGSDYNGNLYNVNTDSGFLTSIGSTGLDRMSGLEYAPDGTLYGLTVNPNTSGNLYSINPSNAIATVIGSGFDADFEGGIAISSSGSAWGTNIGTETNSQLFTIDLNTGISVNLGLIGNGIHDINGLIWRNDGMLVGLDRVTNSLLEINLGDMSTSVLATTDFPNDIGGLTTADYATGFFTLGANLYSVNLFDGSQSYIGSTDNGFAAIELSGIALAPAVVPIPASVWLFGSGLIGLVSVARRKKA